MAKLVDLILAHNAALGSPVSQLHRELIMEVLFFIVACEVSLRLTIQSLPCFPYWS